MKSSIDQYSITGLILDMDGVIWRADQPIGDLPAIFSKLQAGGRKVLLATNNSTRTPEQYIQKLAGLKVNLEPWQVINSSQAAAHYLVRHFPHGGPVYVIGEEGLVQALEDKGFYHAEDAVKAVVVGMDRHLNYEKLTRASLLIRAGVPFIATNSDRTFPTPLGLIPGAGAILAAIEAATDHPPLIVGKPSPEMYRVALERLGAAPEEILAVGDRLETDIAGAQALGLRSALVLSGVTSEIQARQWKPEPDFIAPDLASLAELLF